MCVQEAGRLEGSRCLGEPTAATLEAAAREGPAGLPVSSTKRLLPLPTAPPASKLVSLAVSYLQVLYIFGFLSMNLPQPPGKQLLEEETAHHLVCCISSKPSKQARETLHLRLSPPQYFVCRAECGMVNALCHLEE